MPALEGAGTATRRARRRRPEAARTPELAAARRTAVAARTPEAGAVRTTAAAPRTPAARPDGVIRRATGEGRKSRRGSGPPRIHPEAGRSPADPRRRDRAAR